jgi:hypothetical protein
MITQNRIREQGVTQHEVEERIDETLASVVHPEDERSGTTRGLIELFKNIVKDRAGWGTMTIFP